MKNYFQMADILININGLMLMVMFTSPWDVQIFVRLTVEQIYAELVKQVTIFFLEKSSMHECETKQINHQIRALFFPQTLILNSCIESK